MKKQNKLTWPYGRAIHALDDDDLTMCRIYANEWNVSSNRKEVTCKRCKRIYTVKRS